MLQLSPFLVLEFSSIWWMDVPDSLKNESRHSLRFAQRTVFSEFALTSSWIWNRKLPWKGMYVTNRKWKHLLLERHTGPIASGCNSQPSIVWFDCSDYAHGCTAQWRGRTDDVDRFEISRKTESSLCLWRLTKTVGWQATTKIGNQRYEGVIRC